MSQFPTHDDPRDRDDDDTYDNDIYEDMEGDRDPKNFVSDDDKMMSYLASLEKRGYFI